MELATSLNWATSHTGEVPRRSEVWPPSLHQLEEVARERHLHDDVLVALVVPLAGDELRGPVGAQQQTQPSGNTGFQATRAISITAVLNSSTEGSSLKKPRFYRGFFIGGAGALEPGDGTTANGSDAGISRFQSRFVSRTGDARSQLALSQLRHLAVGQDAVADRVLLFGSIQDLGLTAAYSKAI